MPISSFSVLVSDNTFYVVKDYQNDKRSYYDYLHGEVVSENLDSLEVMSLQTYMNNHSTLFSDAVCDQYLHFTVFDSQKLLQESNPTIADLADYEQKKYLGISRISNTEENTCYIYYVPVTKYLNDNRDKIKIIIDELTSTNTYNTNLLSYLNSNTEILAIEEQPDILELTFNSYIFSDVDSKDILEEVIYTICLSIKDNYEVSEVVIKNENEEIYQAVLKEIE